MKDFLIKVSHSDNKKYFLLYPRILNVSSNGARENIVELFTLLKKRSCSLISEWTKSLRNEIEFFFCNKRCNY